MRRVLWLLLLAGAACGPKVHPQSTFDEDDPRAGAKPAVAAADAGVVPLDAPRAPGVRTGEVTRQAVNAVLDAGPAELLRGLEVTALRPDDKFAGWRLVRFVAQSGGEHVFDAVDVAIGDVLIRVNGHTLETPQDLSALWLELYRAAAIDATIERDGLTFTIHVDVTE